jgi:putative nucleotidyltransferase with HDIG domain
MAAAVSAAASGAGLSAFKRRVWRESLAAAVVCEGLAASAGLEPGEAFVAGLLHDVGKLLAISTLDELFKQRPQLRPDDATLWLEVERTHVKLGALLAQRWQLPGILGAVITAHHDEREQGAPLTRTRMTWCTPSPLRTTSSVRSAQTWRSAARKACASSQA